MDYIGIVEKNMETTMWGVLTIGAILGLYWGYMGIT